MACVWHTISISIHLTEIISILFLPPACEHRLRSLHFKTDIHQQHLRGIPRIDISDRFLPGGTAQEVEWSFNSHLHCLVKCMLPQHATEEQLLCCTVTLSATSPLPATGQLKLKTSLHLVGYKLSCGLKAV